MLQNFSRVPLASTKWTWLSVHLLWSLGPEGTVDNTIENEVMPSWPWIELELVACLLHSFVFLNSYACEATHNCLQPHLLASIDTCTGICTYVHVYTYTHKNLFHFLKLSLLFLLYKCFDVCFAMCVPSSCGGQRRLLDSLE